MGAIVNGMAAHRGTIPYGATFLIFSDYMRPAIRLAALSHLHVILVFTHDSIALGEDGPTHQPIEQLANLRAIPNLTSCAPAMPTKPQSHGRFPRIKDRPVLLVFVASSGADIGSHLYASAQGVRRGAYVLKDAVDGKSQLILIASGLRSRTNRAAADRLQREGIAVRCVRCRAGPV